MDFVRYVYRRYPHLKKDILMAKFKVTPLQFIKKTIINSLVYSLFLSIISIFVLRRFFYERGIPSTFSVLIAVFILFPLITYLCFNLLLKAPLGGVLRRKKDAERDVLFAGRYLLIKINSGKPLLNSLIDASKSFGVGSRYFKEIVDDITLGMPIEEAIDRAMELTPSPNFQKILFQINNSLRIGVDVSETLQGVLDDIASDQMNEIEAYSNKLNSIALFYMMLATVIPSLGLTIFVVVSVVVGIQIYNWVYVMLWFAVVLIQMFFMFLFKSIRPNINF